MNRKEFLAILSIPFIAPFTKKEEKVKAVEITPRHEDPFNLPHRIVYSVSKEEINKTLPRAVHGDTIIVY